MAEGTGAAAGAFVGVLVAQVSGEWQWAIGIGVSILLAIAGAAFVRLIGQLDANRKDMHKMREAFHTFTLNFELFKKDVQAGFEKRGIQFDITEPASVKDLLTDSQ